MQAPASHLYQAQWINRSCSYLETSPIVIMQRYQGPGSSLDIISCYLWLSGRDLRPGPATFIRDDMMSGCHGVWLSCQLITSRKLDSSNIFLITLIVLSPTIVSDDSMISLFLFHHLLRSRHLTSVQSTLVSDLDPLFTPGHSQAANCQPCVPVDLSTLCPAAAISHPKKPLLLPPPSALAMACCSIQQSGPLSVV